MHAREKKGWNARLEERKGENRDAGVFQPRGRWVTPSPNLQKCCVFWSIIFEKIL